METDASAKLAFFEGKGALKRGSAPATTSEAGSVEKTPMPKRSKKDQLAAEALAKSGGILQYAATQAANKSQRWAVELKPAQPVELLPAQPALSTGSGESTTQMESSSCGESTTQLESMRKDEPMTQQNASAAASSDGSSVTQPSPIKRSSSDVTTIPGQPPLLEDMHASVKDIEHHLGGGDAAGETDALAELHNLADDSQLDGALTRSAEQLGLEAAKGEEDEEVEGARFEAGSRAAVLEQCIQRQGRRLPSAVETEFRRAMAASFEIKAEYARAERSYTLQREDKLRWLQVAFAACEQVRSYEEAVGETYLLRH